MVLLVAMAAAGCDGSSMATGPGMPAPDGGGGSPPAGGTLPVTNHAYRLMRGRGEAKGAAMRPSELLMEMGDADAVCLGEKHDDPDAHAAQLMVLDQMIGLAAMTGRRLAMGMEMFQVSFQPLLDQYTAGTIDEATMLARSEWDQRWGIDYALYRPLVDHTIADKRSIRALNASDELAKRIDVVGLSGLTMAEKAMLPELDLTSAEHRAWFLRSISGISAHGGVALDNLYAAQVVRDETMADTAWRWLQAQAPAPRQLAIVAGHGHCMDLAIPARMRRRGARKVLIIHPVLDDPTELAAVLDENYSDVLVVFSS
jgi:uncharacterized iron-regulated protein